MSSGDESGEPIDSIRFQQVASAGIKIWQRWDRQATGEERARRATLRRSERVSGCHTDDLRVAGNTLFTATPATSGQCAASLASLTTASDIPEDVQEPQVSGVSSSGVVAAIPRPVVVTAANDSDVDSISSEICIIETSHGAKRERVRQRQRCGVRNRRDPQGEPSHVQLHGGPVTSGSGGASGSGQQRTWGHPTRKRRRKSKW